jgi:hypothetical protein
MAKTFHTFIAAIALLAFTGCQTITKHRLAGTYYRYIPQGKDAPMAVQKLQLTDSKFIMSMPLNGDMAMDYTVEDNIIYVGGQPSQLCFTMDGMGIISNKGNQGIEGTYIKQVGAE